MVSSLNSPRSRSPPNKYIVSTAIFRTRSFQIIQLNMPYQKVHPLLGKDVELEDSSTEGLPLYEYPRKYRTCCNNYRRPPHWPWMFSTVFFACTTLLLLIHSPIRLLRFLPNVQEYGMSSELGMKFILRCIPRGLTMCAEAARESIEYEDIIWTSGIEENDMGQSNFSPSHCY